MFNITKNGQGNLVFSGADKDGDDFDVEFYGSELVEISVYSATGCLLLNKEQAVALANVLIEQTK
ncbi:hypothetical protein [Erwinia phage Snitter]|nr:hypothetical protein [Erwinia phage Snitter]